MGAALACGLRHSNLRVGLVEPRSEYREGNFTGDIRTSAVAWGSVLYWQTIGVWQEMLAGGATPMHKIIITDGDMPTRVWLEAREMGVDALGYVLPNQVTLATLWRTLQSAPNLKIMCPARVTGVKVKESALEVEVVSEVGTYYVSTKLLVAADGKHSFLREQMGIKTDRRYYDQACIVLRVEITNPHHNVAYERFQSTGTFAILPLQGNHCGVVWTVRQSEVEGVLHLDRETIEAELQRRFPPELGKVSLLSTQLSYYTPQWLHAHQYIRPRFLLIGDAAHTTSPLAGQGMNLGIRDVACLRQLLYQAEDPGAATILQQYEAQRYWDNLGVISLTDFSNRLFSNEIWWCQIIRQVGLNFLHVPLLKQSFMYFMMGMHCAPRYCEKVPALS